MTSSLRQQFGVEIKDVKLRRKRKFKVEINLETEKEEDLSKIYIRIGFEDKLLNYRKIQSQLDNLYLKDFKFAYIFPPDFIVSNAQIKFEVFKDPCNIETKMVESFIWPRKFLHKKFSDFKLEYLGLENCGEIFFITDFQKKEVSVKKKNF